jgi:SAM-dependent methyltransferase
MPKRRRGLERVVYAVQHPTEARQYLYNIRRDALLRLRHRGDHLAYYRNVVEDDLRTGREIVVGNPQRGEWQRRGELQHRYLKEHGLLPHHRVLEIGCGNLRAGWRFIDYLDAGNYYGVDIAPQVILAAQDTIVRQGLVAKLPYLTLVNDMHFAFLPDDCFDYVNAHSVFTHSPLPIIEECFAHIGRVMKPDGLFDFTFWRAEVKPYNRLRQDFYYPTETLVAAAERHGLKARYMDDWEPYRDQSKIRITLT